MNRALILKSALTIAIFAVLTVVPPFLGLGWQNVMANMLIASLYALSFNLLMGQAGMLSFGHAAYLGIGTFAVLHTMVAIENSFPFPTVLLPVLGGLAGAGAGAIAGFFATRRAGVYFSLVTLAMAELLYSLAPHWEGVFGGEAGLSSMRMPSMGISFADSIEVYYLCLAWVAVSVLLLYGYTRTPFGRLTLALRDNEQRVRFMGYNAHMTKVVVFSIAAGFAGIAGGLTAINNETANYSIFSMHSSTQAVLQTFIGGSAVFFGPVVGACLLTLFSFMASEMTRSWMLYQGLVFVLVMMFLPQGIGGAVHDLWTRRDRIDWRRAGAVGAIRGAGIAALAAGTIFVVQFLEHAFASGYKAAVMRGEWAAIPLFGVSWQPLSPLTWAVPLAGFAIGGALLALAKRREAAS